MSMDDLRRVNPDVAATEDIISENGGIPLFSNKIKQELKQAKITETTNAGKKVEQLIIRGYLPYIVVTEEEAEEMKTKGLNLESYLHTHPGSFLMIGSNPHISSGLKEKNLVYVCVNDLLPQHYMGKLAGEDKSFMGNISYSLQRATVPQTHLHFVKAEEIQELEDISYYEKGKRKTFLELPPVEDAMKGEKSTSERVKEVMS
jgi:hypothetical protein